MGTTNGREFALKHIMLPPYPEGESYAEVQQEVKVGAWKCVQLIISKTIERTTTALLSGLFSRNTCDVHEVKFPRVRTPVSNVSFVMIHSRRFNTHASEFGGRPPIQGAARHFFI